MKTTRPAWSDRVGSHLVGWLFLVNGAALLAVVVLIRPWLSCRSLAEQLQAIQGETRQLLAQKQAFGQYCSALESGDPVLLRSLAYSHLGLKPIGAATLDPSAATPTGEPAAASGDLPVQPLQVNPVMLATMPPEPPERTVGHTPSYLGPWSTASVRPVQDNRPNHRHDWSMLVAMTSGWMGLGTAMAGVFFTVLGLTWRTG